MIYETENFKESTDPKAVCSCCGKGGLSIPILILLEMVKMHHGGKAVILTSGARCEAHNKREGGAKRSEHVITEDEPLSDAVDFYVKDVSVQDLYMYLKGLPFANLLGIGKYKGRVHLDTRGYAARWVG